MVSFTLDPFIQKNGLCLVGLTEQLIGKFSVIFCAGFEPCGQHYGQRSNYKHMWGHVDVFEAHLLCLMQI